MKILFTILLMLLMLVSFAQHKISFSSQNYVGLLEGQQGSKFQLETINGLRHKSWFAGFGTGLDLYYLRSVPVFVSLQRDFIRKGSRAFFVAANSGINFPWKDVGSVTPGYESGKQIAGFFGEVGTGYKIGVGKKNDALLLKLAYSYKSSAEKVTPLYFYPYLGMPEVDPSDHFHFHLRRIALQIGWEF